MIDLLAEKKRAAHALVDECFDAGKELMVLSVPSDFPDDDKPALAMRLRQVIAEFPVRRS
jgi:hypothetical protein